MLLRSTLRALPSNTKDHSLQKVLVCAGASAGSVALMHGTAIATERVLLTAESMLPTPGLPPLPLNGPLAAILHSAGHVGLIGAAIGGAGIAAGALWGTAPIDLKENAWWQRLLFQPAASLYNSGLNFREEMAKARASDTPTARFSQGASAGYRVGSNLGKGVGRVQGAMLGGLTGWNLTGQAMSCVEPLLAEVPLPPIAKSALPLVVGAACVVAGQSLGAALGSVVGGVTAGTALGVASGLYSAASPSSS